MEMAADHTVNTQGVSDMSNHDTKSLSHSKEKYEYHIVFAPKYCRQVIYGQLKADIGKTL